MEKMTRLKPLLSTGATAAGAAAVVNVVVFVAARIGGVDFLVYDGTDGPPEEVLVGHVIGMSLISFAVGLAAVAVVVLVAGRSGRLLRPFQVVAAVVAVASAVPLVVSDETGTGTKLSLTVMHLVVGVAYVAALESVRRSAPVDEPTPV